MLTQVMLAPLRMHPKIKNLYIDYLQCADYFIRDILLEPHKTVEESALSCSILQMKGLRLQG